MNLQTIIDQFLLLANKDQSGNTIGPDEATIAVQMATLELLRKLCGLTEEYKPGMPIPRVSVDITQANMDYLDALRVEMGGLGPTDQPLLPVNSNGFAIRPANYFYCLGLSAFFLKDGNVPVETPISIVNEQQWKARKRMRLVDKVKYKYPYCRFRAGVIEFNPKDVSSVTFSYLRYPLDPFYDYYLDANEVVKYLPPGVSYTLNAGEMYRDGTTVGTVNSISQEIEFPISLYPTISNIILGYIGGNLRDQFLKQAAEIRKDKGI